MGHTREYKTVQLPFISESFVGYLLSSTHQEVSVMLLLCDQDCGFYML